MDNDEVIKNLSEFIDNTLPDLLSQRMDLACIMVEGKAKENCPVDDGQLRQSIQHDVEQDKDGVKGFVGTNVECAPYIHEGTGIYANKGDGRQTAWKYQDAKGEWHTTIGQKPKPFLQNAVDDSKDELLEKFKDLF